jgi:hypothetical protein
MDYQKLKALLDKDYSSLSDEDAFSELTTKVVTYKTLNGNALRIWAGVNPTDYSQMKTAAQSNDTAELALMLIQDPSSQLDLADPYVMAMIDGLEQGGVLTAAGKADLVARATVLKTKADIAGFPSLDLQDVKKARGTL